MKRIIITEKDRRSFDLPNENELLIIKLKAEFGAECAGTGEKIPPEVVNQFLKSVYEFEQKFREPRDIIKIYDKVGRPEFKKAEELSDKQLPRELKRLMRQMEQHRLELVILGEYADRTIYSFITEEFFEHEMENLDMHGYVHRFCYEEFHPNHKMEIRNRAMEFLTHWFGKKINKFSFELADPVIHPDTREFPKKEVLKKIDKVLGCYTTFRNCSYHFENIGFEWDEEKDCGKGYAGGVVKYDAITPDNETEHIEGAFQFYLTNVSDWWSIYYFVFPGFKWEL